MQNSQQVRFCKALPDAGAFAPISASVFETLGGVGKPYAALTWSRLRAGEVGGTKDHIYTSTTGREIVIAPGETWCSITTIKDDIQAATGAAVRRHHVKYAVRKLMDEGLIVADRLAAPDTNGRYGKIFTLTKARPGGDKMDVIKEYRVFAYGDAAAFRLGSVATIDPKTGKFSHSPPNNSEQWAAWIAENGAEGAAFTSIGRWRNESEVRKPAAPVFVPWLVLDIDRPHNLPGAWDDTNTILSHLEDRGVDLGRVFVSFSGSKGFHVAIAMSQLGNPIFRDAQAALEILSAFVDGLTDVATDPHTISPLNLVRLTGSQHEETQWYKRTWSASRFRQLPLHAALSDLGRHRPFSYPDPTAGEAEEDMRAIFEAEARKNAAKRSRRAARRGAKTNNRIGDAIENILGGVEEGEMWSDTRAGRDWAAYTLACFIMEHDGQHESVRERLGLPKPGTVLDTMNYWNDNLCYPPLRGRQLSSKIASAKRTLKKKGKL